MDFRQPNTRKIRNVGYKKIEIIKKPIFMHIEILIVKSNQNTPNSNLAAGLRGHSQMKSCTF